MPSNPLPSACVLLLPWLLGVWHFGREAARRVLPEHAGVVAPGLGLAAWLVAVHATSYISGSFVVGLTAGTVAIGGGGLLWRWRAPARAIAAPSPRWMLLGAALATLLVFPMAWRWAFHDELYMTGHMSMTAQIQNGFYPPRHGTFPAFELRYHYGFATVCAALTAMVRLPIDRAIDAVTLAGWFYSWCLAWRLGQQLTGDPAGAMAAPLWLLGGGIPFFCAPVSAPGAVQLLGVCNVDGAPLCPPPLSYFFQHPWSLGTPLALCLLLLLTGPAGKVSAPPSWQRYVWLGALLTALCISQFVLFSALAAVVLLAEPLGARVDRRAPFLPQWGPDAHLKRRAVQAAIAVVVAALVASRLGGFFAPRPDSSELQLSAGIAATWSGTLSHHLQSFGLLLFLGPPGIAWLRRGRLAVALLCAGGLVVIDSVRYAHSWDIAKFGNVAMLGLALGATGVGVAVLRRASPWLRRVALPALALGCCAASVTMALVFALDMRGIPEAIYPKTPWPLDEDDARAATWLRGRVTPGELTFRGPAATFGYAQWAGLPQVWIEPVLMRFGFAADLLAQRHELLTLRPSDAAAWRAQQVRWLVLAPEDASMLELAAAWQRDGVAVERARFGRLLIIDLGP